MRKSMRHKLKTIPPYFQDCLDRRKPFEIRKDDRDFQVGDVLTLMEWEGNHYTGRIQHFNLIYILRNAKEFGLMDGFVILGIS